VAATGAEEGRSAPKHAASSRPVPPWYAFVVDPARLITIPISHYCEKARWVLDATGVRYLEEPHAPVAHLRATRAVGGRTVPLLVHGDRVFRDSSDIARHAEELAPPGRGLVPAAGEERARVLAIEDELDETLGVDARLLRYWYQLRDDEPARALVGQMMGLRSTLARRVAARLFRALIFRRYKVNAETARRAEVRVRATFTRLGDGLREDGAGYLVGGRFTLADLTFAALSAPLLGPPEHPVTGRFKGMPIPALDALRTELSTTPAGRHALRVYREHRSAKS
jgi:glutathione S-transferase